MPPARNVKGFSAIAAHNRFRLPARGTPASIEEDLMTIAMAPIGKVSTGTTSLVQLDQDYAAGLDGLEGFSHVLVLWYAHANPSWDSTRLTISKPYRLAPADLGVFATRSEFRPNPILVSAVPIIRVDAAKGVIEVPWIDAEDGSPILDVKPYQPSADRIRDTEVPKWCRHWPACAEESGDFAWHEEFMF
jgi:tRNA-Thr(GGU) m(6)t(6)A37 methyltransferase TsaA